MDSQGACAGTKRQEVLTISTRLREAKGNHQLRAAGSSGPTSTCREPETSSNQGICHTPISPQQECGMHRVRLVTWQLFYEEQYPSRRTYCYRETKKFEVKKKVAQRVAAALVRILRIGNETGASNPQSSPRSLHHSLYPASTAERNPETEDAQPSSGGRWDLSCWGQWVLMNTRRRGGK